MRKGKMQKRKDGRKPASKTETDNEKKKGRKKKEKTSRKRRRRRQKLVHCVTTQDSS